MVGVALLAVLTVVAAILAAYRVRQHRQAQTDLLYDVGGVDGSSDWRSSIAASTFGSNSSARSNAHLIAPELPVSNTMTELLRSGYLQHASVDGEEGDDGGLEEYGSVAYSVTLEDADLASESMVDGPSQTSTAEGIDI